MVDFALAGEFKLAAILAVKAHPALRQGDSKLVLLAVSKLAEDRDFWTESGIENVNGLGLHTTRSEKLHLLRLAIPERSRARERVEMKFIEGFFGDGRRVSHSSHRHHTPFTLQKLMGINFGNIPRHEMDTGFLEVPARPVLHRDPTDDIDAVALFG